MSGNYEATSLPLQDTTPIVLDKGIKKLLFDSIKFILCGGTFFFVMYPWFPAN